MSAVLYRTTNGALLIREGDPGLIVETKIGGTIQSIRLDEFQARELLQALCPGRRFCWPIGPAE